MVVVTRLTPYGVVALGYMRSIRCGRTSRRVHIEVLQMGGLCVHLILVGNVDDTYFHRLARANGHWRLSLVR